MTPVAIDFLASAPDSANSIQTYVTTAKWIRRRRRFHSDLDFEAEHGIIPNQISGSLGASHIPSLVDLCMGR